MWINVGFSFGFIKMIFLVIFLATSVYLFFDWNYIREVMHENIDAGSSNMKNSLNNLDSKGDSNTDKKSLSSPPKDQSTEKDVLKNGDEFLKKNKEDFFR